MLIKSLIDGQYYMALNITNQHIKSGINASYPGIYLFRGLWYYSTDYNKPCWDIKHHYSSSKITWNLYQQNLVSLAHRKLDQNDINCYGKICGKLNKTPHKIINKHPTISQCLKLLS